MTEPVPACLCGLDTNPVASPRMDIHCPKHDAPGGEPELLPDQVVAMIKESVDCEYSDLVGYKARLEAALVDLNLLLNSRVSQPADWLKDKEIERLKDERNQLAQQGAELWQRANTAQPAGEPSDDMGRCPAIDCLHQCHWGEECSECACIGIPAGATPDGPWAAAIAALPPHKRALFTAPTCANELLARQTSQPSPTPADEEVARESAWHVVESWYNLAPSVVKSAISNQSLLELVGRMTTALAEARRAGTPTTDERERAETVVRQYEATCFGGDRIFMREVLISQVESALSSTPSEQKEKEDV